MTSKLRKWAAITVVKLQRDPAVRLVAMLLAGFAAIVGAVKGYREIFGVEKPVSIPSTVQVVIPPVPSPLPQPEPTVNKPSYLSLWECVPPAKRSEAEDLDQLDRTPLSQSQLDESVVFWSIKPSELAARCLADLLGAGASPDSALSTPVLGYWSGPALHSALNQRQWRNALILLKAGANPNLQTIYRSNDTSGDGELALDMAKGSSAPQNIIDSIRDRGGKSKYDNPAK